LIQADVNKPDCVLLGFRMDDGRMSGGQVHDALIAQESPMVVVFFSGHGDIPTAMNVMKNGAFNWLVKGINTSDLQAQVVAAMQEANVRTTQYLQQTEVMGGRSALTPERNEVARLIRMGWTSKAVVEELNKRKHRG
jgi:FixJ family two-component response regulator